MDKDRLTQLPLHLNIPGGGSNAVDLANRGRQRSVSTPQLQEGRRASSFEALRHAVLTLYRIDDFITEQLGNGFFSDVYKVSL